MVEVEVLDTGYCTGRENQVLRGGGAHPLRFHALCFLLEHPREGLVLLDTGYARRVLEGLRRFPFQLQGLLTPTFIRAGQSAREQLLRRGVAPRDVRWVIVSHFHADHVGGLRDFPHSRVVCTPSALEDARRRQGFSALSRGQLPGLIPENLWARAHPITAFEDAPLPHLGPTHDLFGDGLLRLVPLPGHARGQLGLLVQTPQGEVLLASDGCYLSQNYRENRPAAPVLNLIADDPRAGQETLEKLHRFALERPHTQVWPTHCPEVWSRFFAHQ